MLKKRYKVHGIVRRAALEFEEHRLWRLRKIKNDLNLHAASLESYASLFKVVEKINPDEVYHLASQSYVTNSFDDEFSTFNTNINGTHYILSAVKELNKKTKFYFAGSSEMFGKTDKATQNENTPFHPRSTYGISKVTGYHLIKNYRPITLLNTDLKIITKCLALRMAKIMKNLIYNKKKKKNGKKYYMKIISRN